MTRVLWWVQKGVPHPMKNPAIREKVMKTKKRLYAEGKIIPWNKGIPCTEETRRKISETLKGKPLSEETKRKLSEVRKGKPKSEEWRKNISRGQLGRCSSEKTRKKIGEASKKRWQNTEYRERLSSIRKTWVGSKSPRWKGGRIPYGPNWCGQRRMAIERDNHTCQFCGTPENGREHVVHHIVPFREFGLDRCEEANNLSNLITLCNHCHLPVETGKIVIANLGLKEFAGEFG